MKASETQKFLKAFVLPHLPGWVAKGPMIFIQPIGIVLRSVAFQAPAYGGTRFQVSAVARPLYLPPEDFEGVVFGDRIGVDTWLPGEEPAVGKRVLKLIAGPGMRILNRYATPERIVAAHNNPRNSDPYFLQAIGCSLIWLGRHPQALPFFERARDRLREYVKRPIHGDWGEEMLKRIERLRKMVMSDPNKAKAQLARWATQTAERKRLTPYL